MAVRSLGQLCRRQAIANASKVTYIPPNLPTSSVMSILINISSSDVLKVILANSPHLLDEPEHVDRLWERLCRKEFASLLKKKMAQHSKFHGAMSFPLGTWEEAYDGLAFEHATSLKHDFHRAAESMRAIKKAQEVHKTILVVDPRAIANARPRGQPGASHRPRPATTALGKIRERARMEAFQRNQAMDKAAKEGMLSSAPAKTIRKPSRSLIQRTRGLETIRIQGDASASYQRRVTSTSLSPEGALSAAGASLTPLAGKKPHPPAAAPSSKMISDPTTTKTVQKPAPRNGLFQNPGAKIQQAIMEKTMVKHTDGSTTVTTWTDWTKFQNRQLLATYSQEKQDRLLAEQPTVVFTPAPASSGNKKRNSAAISADNGTSARAEALSPERSTAASPPRPLRKIKGASNVFMPARRH